MTLALSLAIPFAMLLYSNSRISDTKEVLRAEMALGFERVMVQLARLDDRMARLENRMDRFEDRMVRLEDHVGVVHSSPR